MTLGNEILFHALFKMPICISMKLNLSIVAFQYFCIDLEKIYDAKIYFYT
jgi:hypothetical protein